jgi:ComF family protein
MRWLDTVMDLLYPRQCAACGGAAGDDGRRTICWDCVASLQWVVDPFCSLCGDPVDGAVGHGYECSVCRRHRPHFEAARSAMRYRGPLRAVMQAFKYNHVTSIERDLTDCLEACVRVQYPRAVFDAVTCVPLHPRKQRTRTYNQSALLAQGLGRRLRTDTWTRCLRRIKDDRSQTRLTAVQRRGNVRGVFEACDAAWVKGRRMLLVDDVMTTGATVDECSRVLKKAGAASVHVVTVARG